MNTGENPRLSPAMHDAPLAALAERFRLFAGECRRHASPLYEQLSLHIAEDREILILAAAAHRGRMRFASLSVTS